MKKLNILFAAFIGLGLIASCSKSKFEEAKPSQIGASDVVFTINENPTVGQSIGSVQGTTTTGVLSYSIYSQSIPGAVTLNPETGAIAVGKAELFDYEKNKDIVVVVVANNGSLSRSSIVTININNIDDIEFLLTTSKSAYQNAAAGSWVEVTETEYNTVATKLNEVTKIGVPDSLFTKTADHSFNSGDYSWSNSLGVTIPAQSYVFGFKYLSDEDNSVGSTVKISTTGKYSGFSNLGAALPTHNKGTKHFILKGNSTVTGSATGYLAMYFNKGVKYFYKTGSSLDQYMQWNFGNANNVPNSSSGILLYQGLSSTQKQW